MFPRAMLIFFLYSYLHIGDTKITPDNHSTNLSFPVPQFWQFTTPNRRLSVHKREPKDRESHVIEDNHVTFIEIDPDRQVITSDLKEKLLESRPSPNSPVEKSFKGSLDVPALGIHKEVTNSGTEAESQELDKVM